MKATLRSVTIALVLLAPALVIPTTGRAAAITALLFILLAAASLSRAATTSWWRAAIALSVTLAPALILVGAVVDLLPAFPSPVVLRILLAAAWASLSVLLGRSIAMAFVGRRAALDALARATGALISTAFVAGALGRLLSSSRGTDERLAWLLGEEDNAAFVGVAREVVVHGPGGSDLVGEFGAAFMSLPFALLELAGGPLAGEGDVRLQAISLTVVSAVVAICLAGVAIASLVALPHHVSGSDPRWGGPTLVSALTGSLAAAAISLAGLSLLAVMPLQAGFLTFLWGLSLVLVASGSVAVLPQDASAGARTAVLLLLAATVVLLIGSWPFIAAAVAPLALLPLLWVDRARFRTWRKENRALASGSATALLLAVPAGLWFLASLPQIEKVLELGRDVLTVGGSSIHADRWSVRIAVLATIGATLLLTRVFVQRRNVLLALLGPLAGAGLFMAGIRVATDRYADGVMAYAGFKLLFGLVTLALILGGALLVSSSARAGTLVSLVALAVVLAPHVLSESATTYSGWWDRTERPGSPHAIAVVGAIDATTPDVPIRCLPAPGTRIEGVAPWAAYFCVRWVEQGFNEGRFDGNSFRLLNAQGETFEEVVEEILREQQSEYLFAYRLTMGRGWFGWSG
jgi:hypothetical protein